MTSGPAKSPVPQCEPFTAIGSGGVRLVGDRWAAPNPAGTVLLLHGGGRSKGSFAI
jgi:alpha-beta hydrolase superfamily lysophospholipase